LGSSKERTANLLPNKKLSVSFFCFFNDWNFRLRRLCLLLLLLLLDPDQSSITLTWIHLLATIQTNFFFSNDFMALSNHLSFFLAHLSFVGTHVVFVLWLNFLFNDPFDLGLPTMDSKVVKPPDTCTHLNIENLIFDVLLFLVWWGQHSIMARNAYKKAVGLYDHPLERPIFATCAFLIWFANIYFWKPISDCSSWSPFTISPIFLVLFGVVFVFSSLIILGLLWSLPDHVFGTQSYKYSQGKRPKSNEIIRKFPYGLVRHPAASGFLWLYWAIPAYTPNHILLASLWTVFILVGTLVFEEGGLRGPDEFGQKYKVYANEVSALYPNLRCIKSFLGSNQKKHSS